jgi:hypothetical protein
LQHLAQKTDLGEHFFLIRKKKKAFSTCQAMEYPGMGKEVSKE